MVVAINSYTFDICNGASFVSQELGPVEAKNQRAVCVLAARLNLTTKERNIIDYTFPFLL